MEGAVVCAYWNTHLRVAFAFAVCKASAKTTVFALRERLIYHPDFLHSMVFEKGITS